MHANIDEVIDCDNCHAKVMGRVWEIHQIMCNRVKHAHKKK